jgi:hypothetical protein
MQPFFDHFAHPGQALFGLAHETEFFGFVVDEKKHGHVVHDRRHQGHLDDGQVAGVGEFGHEKRAGAHDGRHELSAGGGGRFDGAGHMGPVADFLHHGDGEGARGHDISNSGAGHRSHEAGGDHRGLGRPAGKATGEGVGQFDEKIAAAGGFQKGAEQDEDEDKGGGHADGQAEDALGGQPEGGGDAFDGVAFVDDQFGHVRSEIGIEHRHRTDAGHDDTDDPPAGFQHQQGADDADHQVGRQPVSLALKDFGEVDADVGGAIDRCGHQHPVHDDPEVQTILAGF